MEQIVGEPMESYSLSINDLLNKHNQCCCTSQGNVDFIKTSYVRIQNERMWTAVQSKKGTEGFYYRMYFFLLFLSVFCVSLQ